MQAEEMRRRASGNAPVSRCSTRTPLPSLILVDNAGRPYPADPNLVSALGCLDPDTRMHLRRVSHLAGELASVLGFAPAAQRQAVTGGLLHDIGKSLVP